MTNLYDLEELNPLITNMPPEVQVQYFQRFGPGLIRPFKRSVLDQLTRRAWAPPDHRAATRSASHDHCSASGGGGLSGHKAALAPARPGLTG